MEKFQNGFQISIILNRVGTKDTWDTYHNTILAPAQYSAFWEKPPKDSNLKALRDPIGNTSNPNEHRKWKKTYEIAEQVMRGEAPDPTSGSNHYYDDSISRPSWLAKKNFVIKINAIYFHKL